MKVQVGMLVTPSYSKHRTYRITGVRYDCTCADYVDVCNNGDKARPRDRHIEISCIDIENTMGGTAYMALYPDGEKFRSMEKTYCSGKPELDYDYYRVWIDKPLQMELF